MIRLIKVIILVVSLSILMTACSDEGPQYLGTKQQVSKHIEENMKIEDRFELNIFNPCGNLIIYKSNEERLSFEIVKRVRGNSSKERLAALINEIDHSLTEYNGVVTLELNFPEEFNPINNAADLTVFIPEKLTRLNLVIGVGTIKIHDDLASDLSAKIDTANMYINILTGAADIEARMGNVNISGGLISAGSVIKTGMGNIGVKADFDESGSYIFETGLGNIKIVAPGNRKLSFANIGEVKVNDFETTNASANFRLKSEMGEISIIKY